MKLKQLITISTSYALIGLITLSFLEISFQISSLKMLQNSSLFKRLLNIADRKQFERAFCHSDWWKHRFIERYENNFGMISNEPSHDVHPTRGWIPKPNLNLTLGSITYTTNKQGHRALKDYEPNAQQYTVLIVGDSFTFGIDADDRYVWTNLVQAKDKRLNIVNLAVGGYGLDQMYVTLKESIKIYNPDLVITAFISDDLFRMKLNFRDYKKPQLKLKKDGLKIANIPIDSLENTYLEAKQDLQENTIPVLKLDDVIFNLSIFCQGPAYKLISQTFLEMQEIAETNDAEFLLVYLASDPDLANPKDVVYYGATAFLKFISENSVNYLNTVPHFLARKEQDYRGGHYQKNEAILVSDLIYEKIIALDSFAKFRKKEP